MKRTTALLPLTLALAACAGQANPNGQPKPGSSAAAPVTDRQRIVQAGYFDVGTLTATPPAIPAQVDKQVLGGVEMVARPLVIECVVDPQNRGPEKVTKIVVDASLTDAGVDHKVSGQNLTPAGITCITSALGKFTGASAGLNAKSAADKGGVSVHLEVTHTVGESPSVVLGTSEASDVSAAIRLALPSWGECLADWKSAAPRSLKATIKVTKPKAAAADVTPTEVTFEPAGDPTADKVAACLKTKVMALKLKTPKEDSLTVPHTFRFVHSGIPDVVLPGATPDVELPQIDVQRLRREAERTIVDAERNQLSNSYNATVTAYKASAKDPKAPKVELTELVNKCKALLAADDKLIETLQKVAEGEDIAHKYIAEQNAKDPSWAPIEQTAARQLAEAQKTVESMKNNRKLDENVCPKVKL